MAAQEGGQKRRADEDEEEARSLQDLLEECDEREETASAVLAGSDPEHCSYPKGYVKRQALYACRTCTPEGEEAAGICLACSNICHDGHTLYELYTKRLFRCDCGNRKFKNVACKLFPDKDSVNVVNKYNDNFFGLYCTCKRPYPDLENENQDEMIQCVLCEDWFHEGHLGAVPDENVDYQEMVCQACMNHCSFLWAYAAQHAVPTVTLITPMDADSGDVTVDMGDDCETGSMELKNGAGCANGISDTIPDKDKANILVKEIGQLNGPSMSQIHVNEDINFVINLEDGVNNSCKLKNLSAKVIAGDTATFWPLGWRAQLCVCPHCMKMYSELEMSFLVDESDTVLAYEAKGESDDTDRMEPMLAALGRMDHRQKLEIIYHVNDMKTELKDYLKKFADEGKIVKSEDIQQFFDVLQSKKKRRLDEMQYFCR